MPVLWRPRGTLNWFPGTSVNTSQSGILIQSREQRDVGTDIELLLAAGYENAESVGAADVLCAARIVRVIPSSAEASDGTFAASVQSFSFLSRPGLRHREA